MRGDAPTTRPSLLVRLRDARDEAAWAEFVDLYAPLVYGFLRKRGLQDADAADLTQDVLRSVATGASRLEYDPCRGLFRGWLFTVVRNRLRTFLANQKRRVTAAGGSDWQDLLARQPGREPELEAVWDQEYEQRLFHWAAERVRREVQDTTWQAFWRTAVEGQGGQEVAAALGLSVAAVYLAKGRVRNRLKELIRQLHPDG
jgi:RNA polymerase sigma-70 factor (ECF subfamily)